MVAESKKDWIELQTISTHDENNSVVGSNLMNHRCSSYDIGTRRNHVLGSWYVELDAPTADDLWHKILPPFVP